MRHTLLAAFVASMGIGPVLAADPATLHFEAERAGRAVPGLGADGAHIVRTIR